jgi:hypothetical protein
MKKLVRSFSALLLGSLPLLFIKPAMAWDGIVVGKISQIDVAAGNNSALRVYFVNQPPLCSSASKWAYINETDSNYKVFVATLTAAKMANQSVTIYSNRDSATGYCHIGYISVTN